MRQRSRKSSYADAAEGVLTQNENRIDVQENAEGSHPSKQVSGLRKIILQARNEELEEEKERKSRACNLIIHGVSENETDRKPLKAFDEDFLVNFINAIGASAVIKAVFRLGKKEEGKTRPLKVILEHEAAKNEILSNLGSLKGLEAYKGISVTEDYTINEREQIKSFVTKAKELNEKEPEDSRFEWKVRGTPKNGLQVKKFRKRTPLQ